MGSCMDRIRQETGVGDRPMTYAGRLDPMAEGLVIFLVDDLRFKKDAFLAMIKTYDISFFLGYTTDTYDVLGIPTQKNSTPPPVILESITGLQSIGIPFIQPFPQYSSRKYNGKPLFVHARESAIVPQVSHQVTLFGLSGFISNKINKRDFFTHITQDVQNVSGDFRQTEIMNHWNQLYDTFPDLITMYHVTLQVSSGFYVRTWVHTIGENNQSGAVTFSIKRSTIGVFTMSMLNGGSYRIFNDTDPIIINCLHNYHL